MAVPNLTYKIIRYVVEPITQKIENLKKLLSQNGMATKIIICMIGLLESLPYNN